MGQIEILAPAGGFPSVEAAVRCGADAVYLGAKVLNARRNAANFDDLSLEETVKYCHERDVRVHLTLNTLMYDSEISQAVQVIEQACRADVDAVIVQDMGVVSLLQQICPQLPLHASTQMAVHNLEGALQMQQMGFQRVVLAREMSREEIARVVNGCDIETEIFVHGALCMCVSGQCYLSSMIGERSGNRGLCAQPCRLPHKVGAPGKPAGDSYCLSLKDLSLIERMEELKGLGITSLKIEGRMKRPEYVAAAVSACVQAREGEIPDISRLRAVFSRSGFTDGYFAGKLGREMFGIRQKEDVVSAQGVLGELASLYRKEAQRVPVAFRFTLRPDVPAQLRCEDHRGNVVTVSGDLPQKALNRPTDAQTVEKSLAKTGSTPYFPESIHCDLAPGLMLPVSALNALRREALEQLGERRGMLHHYQIQQLAQPVDVFPKHLDYRYPALRARFHTMEGLTQDMVDSLEMAILPLESVFNSFHNPLLKEENLDKIAVEIPRMIFHNPPQIAQMLEQVYRFGIRKAVVHNIGAVYMAGKIGFFLIGGWGLNVANTLALEKYRELGLSETELSFELSVGRIRQLGDKLPYGVVSYGHLPLMITRNCPVKNAMGCAKCGKKFRTVTDRKGVDFFVDCQNGCSQLFNGVPLYLADRMEEFQGIRFQTLYFTRETPQQIRRIIEAYRHRYGRGEAGFSEKEFTRGLYYRNVL